MARWSRIAIDNLAAAGLLLRDQHPRSSVSRAYFAAFAAVAAALEARGVTFAAGRAAPSHAALRKTAEQNLGHVTPRRRNRLVAQLNQLYQWRLAADYQPGSTVGHTEARAAVNAAANVLGIIGIQNGHSNGFNR